MTTRLAFIKQSAFLASGMLVKPSSLLTTTKKVGLQLYTLRNELSKDLNGTLSKVAQFGYADVETFGYNGQYWNLTATEFSKLLKSLNLVSTSGHYYAAGFYLHDGWEEKLKAALHDASVLGQTYFVVPFMEESYRKSLDNYKKLAERYSKAAQICKQAGMGFAYHNHNFEFDPIEGQTGYDVLMKETNSLVKFEMDIYWVSIAGKDPVQLIKSHPGRFPLWHVKDMDNTPKKFFTEVGNGVIDFKKIFANAGVAGMKHFYVEQDVSPASPFDSIQKSITYIKKNLIK